MKKCLISWGIYFLFQCTILFGQSYGRWIFADSLNEARYNHASLVLRDGKILVTGGNGFDKVKSSEVYDPTHNFWQLLAPHLIHRSSHNLVLLSDNRVLAIGGYETKSCEIYDPLLDEWSITDSIKIRRIYSAHRVIRLNEIKILIIGGKTIDKDLTNLRTIEHCEAFDESSQKWNSISALNIPREYHSATLLDDGRILVAGGGSMGNESSCEIYNPATNSWTFTGDMNIGRSNHSALLLSNGDVLVIGGNTNLVEIFNHILEKWEIVGFTNIKWKKTHLHQLGDRIIIFGSDESGKWELYDIKSHKSLYVGNTLSNKLFYTSEKVNKEKIIVVGGEKFTSTTIFPTKYCELFDPTIVGVEQESSINDLNNIEVQLYPNPFNSSAKLKLFLPYDSEISINIYNILGENISNIFKGYMFGGHHEILFEARQLSSGLYICQILTPQKLLIKKLCLLK